MSPGERLAQELTARFLGDGNFVNTPQIRQLPSGATPAGSKRADEDFETAFAEGGYAGLVVQAVGYEVGGSAERVYIYAAKAGRRAIRELPADEEQVPVEINRVGKVVVRPDQASSKNNRGQLYLRGERIACGSSCAPSGEDYSGTLGALVRKKGSKQLYVLSNNHVLAACNHTPVGMPIMSPSNEDSGPNRRAPSEIARHAEICELRSGEPTLVPVGEEDLAIAQVSNAGAVTSWQGDGTGYDTPTKEVAPTSGMSVKKYGRTTGLTVGKVEAYISHLMALPYKTKHFTATVYFRNIWTVLGTSGEFALAGDSGSLVVTEDGTRAVGILFATGGDYGFIIPIDRVTGRFGGLQLVGGHGV